MVPADGVTMPQMMLISVVLPAPFGPEQREDLAAADLEIDVLEGVEAGGVGLGETRDGEHGHGRDVNDPAAAVLNGPNGGRQIECFCSRS